MNRIQVRFRNRSPMNKQKLTSPLSLRTSNQNTSKIRRELVFKLLVYTRYEHFPRGASTLVVRFKIV